MINLKKHTILTRKQDLQHQCCDYSDAYIVVKGIITVSADKRDRDEMNR